MKKILRFFYFNSFTAVLLLLCFTSCKTTGLLTEKITEPAILPLEELCPEEILWKNVEAENIPAGYIQSFEYVVKSINAEWKCIKIDLDTPELKLISEPSKENLGKHFQLLDFARKNKTVAAINTVPFTSTNNEYLPVSVVKFNNEIICEPNSRYSALGFYFDDGKLRGKVLTSQTSELIDSCDYAFGGFFTILKNRTIYEFEKNKRSRTAAGVSFGGRYLYLFAGCGIDCPNGRNGFNYEECALILQKLGCSEALEMDGGHSTGLTLNNRNFLKPSLQRKIPAAFGIKFSE